MNDVQSLLEQRRALRRQALYAVGNEAYLFIMRQVEELDKKIPWVHYKITGMNVEARRDGVVWEFQSLDPDLAEKPLIEWTTEELRRIPWNIEDLDLAEIEKL